MTYEPVLFQSTMFETANEAVLFCKESLEKKGFSRAADQLACLGPITGEMMGELALHTLEGLQALPVIDDELREYLGLAASTTRRALASQAVRAAA